MSENSVTRTGDEANRDAELESAMADYIRACDAGQRPDRQQVLAQHPEIAKDLREFFENRDRMEQLAQPFAPSVPPYEKSTLIRAEAEQVDTCIGPYTLVQKLGEGGMGEVWVAKQSEPVKRKVALKLIKRGMDSKDVLARFEQERQALAMMDHPNIAKMFDGGVVGQAFQPDSATPSQAGKPDQRTEDLVRREGGETFGLRVDLDSQDVMQTQGLTLRSQLRLWSAPCQRSFGFVAERLYLEGLKSERHRNPKATPKSPKLC